MPGAQALRGDPATYLRGLPVLCQEYVPGALDGDPEAVFSLMVRARNADRGMVAKALWKHGVPVEALRVAVENGWDHDHAEMFAAFGRSLPRVFKDARFPTDHLPDQVTVWRGGRGAYTMLGLGVSWTLDRDCACWFAMRFDPPDPLVLRRTVRRSSVLAHVRGRGEDEIVIWRVAPSQVDGDRDDWRAAFERYERAKNEEAQASMAVLRAEVGAI